MRVKTIHVLFIFIFVLTACAIKTPTPDMEIQIATTTFVEATNTLTPTILPTNTSTSTPIPTSTKTPMPTSTPVPPTPTVELPSILSDYLANAQITRLFKFDNMTGWSTYNSQTGKISDGQYEITGQPGWSSGLVRDKKFKEGEGLVLKFMYTQGTEFEFILDRGEWQTDSYRRFGVFGFEYPQANLTQGVNAIGNKNLHGNFKPSPDKWYKYMVGIGFEGDFIAIIWDPADPTRVITYRERIGENWDNFTWQFTAKAAEEGMTLYIDDFAEITFNEIIW